MKQFDIEKVFSAISQLNKQQLRELISTLNSHGHDVSDIECYTYPEATGIKHLFFHFRNSKEATPYYILDDDILEIIRNHVSV